MTSGCPLGLHLSPELARVTRWSDQGLGHWHHQPPTLPLLWSKNNRMPNPNNFLVILCFLKTCMECSPQGLPWTNLSQPAMGLEGLCLIFHICSSFYQCSLWSGCRFSLAPALLGFFSLGRRAWLGGWGFWAQWSVLLTTATHSSKPYWWDSVERRPRGRRNACVSNGTAYRMGPFWHPLWGFGFPTSLLGSRSAPSREGCIMNSRKARSYYVNKGANSTK